MKKRNWIGAVVMVLLIALAVPLGVHTSLADLRYDAESSFYYDKTGYSISLGIDEREAAATNLITVAQRYTQENEALTQLIGDLDYAVSYSENSYDSYDDRAQGNEMMGQAAQALYQELKNTQLSEEDEKYPDQLMAQMDSEQDKINRSSYNEDAQEFNARLKKFPVNLLLPVVGVEPLATFDQESGQ